MLPDCSTLVGGSLQVTRIGIRASVNLVTHVWSTFPHLSATSLFALDGVRGKGGGRG